MTMSGFQCPACGADFEVRERLDEAADAPQAGEAAPDQAASAESDEPLPCPNCGAEVDHDRSEL